MFMETSTWQKVVFVINFLLGDTCTQNRSILYFSPIFEKNRESHKRVNPFGIFEIICLLPGYFS